MIKNYFKTAWRNLKEYRFHTFVNISGLALGLATAILLLLWVQHERSYDRFHHDYSRIHRLTAHLNTNNVWEGVPGPLAVYAQSLPEVETVVRLNDGYNQVLATTDRRIVLDDITTGYVDSTFFDLFTFELLKGESRQLFLDPHNVVLTK